MKKYISTKVAPLVSKKKSSININKIKKTNTKSLNNKPVEIIKKSQSSMKDEDLINSESTQDKKINVIENLNSKIIHQLYKKVESIEFIQHESESSYVLSEKTNSLISESANLKLLATNLNSRESKISNFLNLNLGELQNLTSALDEEPNNLTIISSPPAIEDIFNINMNTKDSFDSELYYKNNFKKSNNLSISKISMNKLSIDKKFVSPQKILSDQSAKLSLRISRNISILSSENLSMFEVNEDSEYDNTDEFDNDANFKNVNKVYCMKIKENDIKSHMDIINLNFMLRFIFHKSEILTEVFNILI
jgi:hypothetical protein